VAGCLRAAEQAFDRHAVVHADHREQGYVVKFRLRRSVW
jgi:hypothetical protein